MILKNKTPMAILLFVIIICLLPFINKAFHIDDILFIRAAQQIKSHPMDFYGFYINWHVTEVPAYEAIKNPPLNSFYIALAICLFNLREVTLHLVFLVPIISLAVGTYYLAQRFCSQPVVATLAGILTPACLVSSTTVMCDVFMLSFWVWALVLWLRGIEENKRVFLMFSVVCICASSLMKYYGISLIPILFIYTVMVKRRIGNEALFLAIPILALTLYSVGTNKLYGYNLLSQAFAFSVSSKSEYDIIRYAKQILTSLIFIGGCITTALFYIPLLWSRRAIISGAVIGILLIPVLSGIFAVELTIAVQMAIFLIAGMSVIILAGIDVVRNRDALSFLLLLWIVGTALFAAFINWTVSGRTILPMAPAVGISLIRHIDFKMKQVRLKRSHILFPIALSLIIALIVTRADYTLAGTAREAAVTISNKYGKSNHNLWFQGHWGFQYYMEQFGAKALDSKKSNIAPNDIVVSPLNNTWVLPMRREITKLVETIQFFPCKFVTTMNVNRKAGFYSDVWGPLPFTFGPVPPEKYYIFRIKEIPL
ncbi:glycosyltransferase family 39 protein [Candidatus Omnitrophota bacterium]